MKVKCVAEHQQQQNMLALATNDKQLSAQNVPESQGLKTHIILSKKQIKVCFYGEHGFRLLCVCVVFGGGGGGLHLG